MMSIKSLFKSRPEREAWHAAVLARDAAQTALGALRDNESRLQAVVVAYDDCQRDASAAVREEKQARTRYVQQGGKYSDARELAALETKTAEKKRLAERAQFDAEVARNELRSAAEAVKQAEHDLRNAERAIESRIGLLLLAEFEPTLERFEKIAAEYHACLIEVAGMHDYIYSVVPEGERRISRSLNAARALVKDLPDMQISPGGQVTSESPPEVIALTRAWRARAAMLRANPDAD